MITTSIQPSQPLPTSLIERAIEAAGRRDPDLIEAHKWLNLAAQAGNPEAVRRRRELAAEMSAEEIAAAQRAAREWVSRH